MLFLILDQPQWHYQVNDSSATHTIVIGASSLDRHILKDKNYIILRGRSFVEWDKVSCVQTISRA